MDVIRDSIEEQAEAALNAQRELPLYRHDAAYAREQGDLDLYRASRRANIACKEAIENAIAENYRDNRLGGDAVPQVIEQFGYTRTLYVLANTVQQKDWDGRFSPANKAWAKTVDIPPNPDGFGGNRNLDFVVDSHPGLVDLFLSQTRQDYLRLQPLTPEEIHAEAARSCRSCACRSIQQPHGTHYMARISAGFSGPRRHPGPRPADEPAAVPQSGDHRHEGFARHLCHHPGQRGPLQESAPAPPFRPQQLSRSRALLKKARRKRLPTRNGSRNGERPEAQTGCAAELPGLPGGTGADRAEDGPAGDEKPGSLSAEDGPGRLCGAVGLAGAEGAGVPASPEQQQSESAHTRVHETGRIYDADLEDISQRQEALWDGVHRILTQLAKLS